jgi:hypothetical protein
MSALSRLSSFALVSFVLSVSAASEAQTWTIDKDRTTATKHGLYEIQQEAQAFLLNENKRRGTDFFGGEPDPRVLVPTCTVPLKLKWGEPAGLRHTVHVICRKSVSKGYPRWDVQVPAFSAAAMQAKRAAWAASSPASR